MRHQEEKIPGGKLVRLTIKNDGDNRFVQLSGDFFIHPEEGVFLIEEALRDIPENTPESLVQQTIGEVVRKARLEMIGIDVGVIARLYSRCRVDN
ncbi:MAG TPA: hypothetical protein VK436_16590 [Methanocella sp.]|nr:hypothetical protein [Methanocella sp.]